MRFAWRMKLALLNIELNNIHSFYLKPLGNKIFTRTKHFGDVVCENLFRIINKIIGFNEEVFAFMLMECKRFNYLCIVRFGGGDEIFHFCIRFLSLCSLQLKLLCRVKSFARSYSLRLKVKRIYWFLLQLKVVSVCTDIFSLRMSRSRI